MNSNQKYFTDEQISKASQVNIISYAQSKGYALKKISSNSYKIPGYGGLFIEANGSKWNWFSKGIGGGSIQFVMELEGKSWAYAVRELLGDEYEETVVRDQIKKEPKGQLVLPEKNDTYKHLFAYLIRTRKIDHEIVIALVEAKKIYEDKYKNCVFVGYDENESPAYASVRSTRTTGDTFRGDVRNSDKSCPFYYEGKSTTVCVFESPIDLMSYLSILKIHGIDKFNHHMISLGGVTDKSLEKFLVQNPDITTIMICLDNDPAGNEACIQIQDKYGTDYKLLRHTPKNKDFNEDLCRMKAEIQPIEGKDNGSEAENNELSDLEIE